MQKEGATLAPTLAPTLLGGGDCLPSLNRVKNARNANNARSASNASRRKPPQGVVENREQPQTVVEHY